MSKKPSKQFEQFIMRCCKSSEWRLRNFLRKSLTNKGFIIQEDDYQSRRGGKYNTVHNMLAIRGNPQVCLVAHTDVCRDHHTEIAPKVNPVVKELNGKRIIQDEFCDVQVGGDDRLGVAINMWLALNNDYDLGLLFTTDEEVGLVSADYVKFDELNDFQLLCQVDRGNRSNQIVSWIGGTRLCSDETLQELIKLTHDIELPRVGVNGMITDVAALKQNGYLPDAINMTCGYHNSYGASENEYIDIQEAKDTLTFVDAIVKHYATKSKKVINDTDIKQAMLTSGIYNFDVKDVV